MSTSENKNLCSRIHNKMFPMDDQVRGPGCCFCLPLKLGISIICLFFFLDFVNVVQLAIRAMTVNLIVGGICLPLGFLFMLIPCIMAIKYCRDDTLVHRKRLIAGCTLCVFVNIVLLIILAGSTFFDPEMSALLANVIVSHLISIVLWLIARQACKQWVMVGELFGVRNDKALSREASYYMGSQGVPRSSFDQISRSSRHESHVRVDLEAARAVPAGVRNPHGANSKGHLEGLAARNVAESRGWHGEIASSHN